VDSVRALEQGNVTAEDVTIDMRMPVPLKPASVSLPTIHVSASFVLCMYS